MKKIMKKFLRKDEGFAASDTAVAILIITLFTGIIATLLYNTYLANASLKRMSTANLYITDVFEYVQKTSYTNVTESNLINYFNTKYYDEDKEAYASNVDEDTDAKYKVIINVQKYNQTAGNSNKIDLVEEITMTVKYKVGNRNQEITMSTIKQKE